MVYFGKKQGTGPAAGSATLAGNNTFTGTNTFNNPVVIPEPTQDNEAANKKYVDDLNDQLEQEIAQVPKLGLANTFTDTNTFNNAIVAGGTTAIKKAGQELTAIELTGQQSKTIHFDFLQPSSGFRNYCSIDFRIKVANGTYENGLKIEARDNASGLAYSTDCAYYLYDNKEIRGLANPTQNNSAATKSYVDGLLGKDITTEQLAPFKLGTTTVYMKYVNETISFSAGSSVKVNIPNLPNISKLVGHGLSINNSQLIPWISGTVQVVALVENNVLKLQGTNADWVNNVSGMVYYTKP